MFYLALRVFLNFLSSYFLISELASHEMDLLDDMQAKKDEIELSKQKLKLIKRI